MKASESFKRIDELTIVKTVALIVSVLMAIGIMFLSCTLLVHAEESATKTFYYTYHVTYTNDKGVVTKEYEATYSIESDFIYGTLDGGLCHFGNKNRQSKSLSCTAFKAYVGFDNIPIGDSRSQLMHDTYTAANAEVKAKANFPIFASKEAADAYFETGDIDGVINGFQISGDFIDSHDVNYKLTGFTCDNTIKAGWTGATEPTLVPDNENVTLTEYVKIMAYYDSGIEDVSFVPLSDFGFDILYSSISNSEKPLMMLRFTPIYSTSDGIFGIFNTGKSIDVEFDAYGNITSIDGIIHGGGGTDNDGNDYDVPEEDIIIDSSVNLGYLKNVRFERITVDASEFGKDGLYSLMDCISWDVNKDYPTARIEIRVDCEGKHDPTIYSRSVFKSYADGLPYTSGKVIFDRDDAVLAWMHDQPDPAKYLLERVAVECYYVRMIVLDENTGMYNVGGWTRIEPKVVAGNNIVTGSINEDKNSYGDFVQDSESDDSYEYGMDGDNNPFNWDDVTLTGNGILGGLKWFNDTMSGMSAGLSNVAVMFRNVFSFLPSPITMLIGSIIVVCIILRILGR